MVKPEQDSTKDYYQVLGISPASSQIDIRKAFLDLARTQHPDKNPGHESVFKAKFQVITTAYDVLKDPILKRTYDQIRPLPRRPSPRGPMPTALRPQAKTQARRQSEKADEPSTRAYAYPRQAKGAANAGSHTIPRKTPSSKKDPPTDPPFWWTPNGPAKKSTTAPTSTQQPSTKATSNPDRYAKTNARRAPTAAQSAFFNASPSSPKVNSSTPSRKSATNVNNSAGPQMSSDAPDWTLKEKWWGQSNTAYSNFHQPSSRYSPYTTESSRECKDSPATTPSTSRVPKNPSSQHGSRTESDHEASTQAENHPSLERDGSGTAYHWQRSQTAYQQKSSRPILTPKRMQQKIPLMEDIKAGNPFFENRVPVKPLDSDRMDCFDDSDKEPDSQKTARPERVVSPGSASSSSISEERLDSSSHSEDSQEDKETARCKAERFRKHKPIEEQRHFQSFRQFRRPTVEADSDEEENVASSNINTANILHTPNSTGKDSFRFQFSASAAQEKESQSGSASSQRVGVSVPYVKFNAVPDLDFTSPVPKGGATSSPFAAPSPCPLKSTPETKHETDSSAKKHSRGEGQSDPRYAPVDHDLQNASTTSKLAGQFAKTSIQKSPDATGPHTTFGHDAIPCFSPSIEKPSFPRYPSDIPSYRNPATSANEPVLKAEVPSVPEALLSPLRSSDSLDTAFTDYLMQCSIFNAYNQAWQDYEAQLLSNHRQGHDAFPLQYCQALEKHHKVMAVHAETVNSHAKCILAAQQRV